jgi:hypothetical protein
VDARPRSTLSCHANGTLRPRQPTSLGSGDKEIGPAVGVENFSAPCFEEIWFARDSPLEGGGYEPSVPRDERWFSFEPSGSLPSERGTQSEASRSAKEAG